MNKQNLSLVKNAPAPKTVAPWFRLADGFYDAQLVDVTTSGAGDAFRFRYTFRIFGADGLPIKEKNVDVGGRKTKTENLKDVTLIRTTSPSMQEGSKRRQILSALPRGRDLLGSVPLEEMTPDDIIGSPVQVLVLNQKNRSGQVFSNITEVFSPDLKKQNLRNVNS
mgnify:FL=1|tara:strand:- start:166 stop:663 length:498 start_codon:yes stop_codon:yes gene_type:complete